jgi:peptide-methionine (S)-S-oxide reductase
MRAIALTMLLLALSTTGCRTAEKQSDASGASGSASAAGDVSGTATDAGPTRRQFDSLIAAGVPHATFAGGCFWCVESAFDAVPGVIATISGYTGGTEPNPTYDQVSSGRTGHAEIVTMFYDATKVGYAELLDVYWRNIDPLTGDRQFCDAGTQYRPVIFYHDEEQRRLADSSKAALAASGRFDEPIVTEVNAATTVSPAEEYHQDFHLKNPERYKEYREGCRRDQRLKELWGS